MSEREKHQDDPVELRATRNGDSLVMQLTRAGADAEAADLQDDGWSVEVLEVQSPR